MTRRDTAPMGKALPDVPQPDFAPTQPATFRSVIGEIRPAEFALFAAAIVLPLLALAALLPA